MDIVVGALSGMVDALPGKLGALLEQEYALLSGVRDDVRFLQSELGSMRAAIHHSESLDESDAQTRAWVGRVRELAYDVEDWVDLFVLRVDAGRGAGNHSFPRFLRWRFGRGGAGKLPTRHVIANELKDLKERVVELSEQRKRYSLGALPFSAMARPLVDVRLAALFVDTGNVVGLDGPIQEVTEMATEAGNKDELRVVSIVGMAGSGKTTLAHAVFRRLQVQFHCCAFVSVGQKPDMCRTLQDMLSSLGGMRRREGEDIHKLISSLREMLRYKRYLIVVDDLWSSEQWATIRCCLLENNTRSSIITTSRNNVIVSSGYGSANHVYKIGLLGDADARKLFLKRIFGTGQDCPQELQDVCAKIVRRCGGLPLALISVASMLANKQQLRHEWEKLGSNLLWSSHTDDLKQIINFSYNDLMPHLRTCMLYLSIFPEHNEVEVERLVRRWIAEGFIGEARSTSSVEDIAIGYFNELINRNMVQPLHLNHDGVPRYCKVHPIIHNFIVNKSVEENFVTLVDTQDHRYVPNNDSTVRRLSVQSSSKGDQTVAQYATDLSHARSVTVFGQANTTPKLTDLKVLRVLDLQGCDGPVCLDGLGKLILLRYLSLRGADISDLPQTIGELRCLETLDVRSTKVKELPSSIVRLEKLMHLLSGSAKLPHGIAKMMALQTLSCAIVAESYMSVIEEISKCAKLRELEMFCDTEMPGETRVVFPHDGFQSLEQLRIWCSLASVNFGPGVLPTVQMLELMFEGARADESSCVLGIDNLPSLKYVLIDFSKHGAGTMATVDAVRKAADRVNCVIIKVEGKSY
ncbi:unnamed protein product [Urochloa decumbens]|uniref:AAA+ ATPase domain-containing protein n=1 Tax=Urochloa decumbens TaxID=240449 RepID=A0ABC9AX91_9POAL